jgi:natural product precursor
MKKLNKLVLNELSKKELSDKAMSGIKGGGEISMQMCTCGCCYAGQGGSDTFENGWANCRIPTTTLCPNQDDVHCPAPPEQ